MRYWRVSSTLKVAVAPYSRRRYRGSAVSTGLRKRRSGMCSQYAWYAALRRAAKRAVVSLPWPGSRFSGVRPA